MNKRIYHTVNDFKELKIEEHYEKKLPNFQLVRPLTVQQQIERFTAAGRQMEKYAGLGVYDFDAAKPIDLSLDDPTRDPDFDLIDAAVAQRDLALKMQAANAAGTETQSVGSESSGQSVKTDKKDEGQEPRATEDGPSPGQGHLS